MDAHTDNYSRALRMMITDIMRKTRRHLTDDEVDRLLAVMHIMAPATWTQKDSQAHIRQLTYRVAETLDIPPWD